MTTNYPFHDELELSPICALTLAFSPHPYNIALQATIDGDMVTRPKRANSSRSRETSYDSTVALEKKMTQNHYNFRNRTTVHKEGKKNLFFPNTRLSTPACDYRFNHDVDLTYLSDKH